MKNPSALLVIAVLCCTLSSTGAYAITPVPVATNFTDSLRGSNSNEIYLRLNEISSRAARHFEKKFPGITQRKWVKTTAGYLVRFIEKGIHTHVYFNNKGRVVLQARYFNENNMPVMVKRTLLKSFPGYTIGVVTEATTVNAIFYHIHIRNVHSVKTVRVYDSVAELIDDNEI